MKKLFRLLFSTSLIMLLLGGVGLHAQSADATVPNHPWSANEVMSPEELAGKINAGSDILILNTGPVDDIKGAVRIGAVEEKKNLRKLKRYLRDVPTDREIVFYCGCCAMSICPNILPAYELLKEKGYTNFKILNIEENLKVDWIAKGYPLAEKE